MTYTKQDIADHLDLAVLKPTATMSDVLAACQLANAHNIKSVCVAPCYVQLAAQNFKNVSTVIGFPHGTSTPKAKHLEAVEAISLGARELDVVVNFGQFLAGDWRALDTELTLIVSAARQAGVLVKAILETCYYSKLQLIEACYFCVVNGVDFVKTSTGFGPRGPLPCEVQVMLDAVQGMCGVKASGGINTHADVAMYLDMGCTRIGSSKFLELL